MRAGRLAPAAILLAGCATFDRATLEPVARTGSADVPYAQVREVGAGPPMVVGRFADVRQLGVTVDVRNTSCSPLTIDVGKTTISFESTVTGARVPARAISTGAGPLPAHPVLNLGTLVPLTLAPSEVRTFWIAFERIEAPARARVILMLPISSGQPIQISLFEPGGPLWISLGDLTSATGYSVRVVGQTFGSGGDVLAFGVAVWHATGSVKIGLSAEVGQLFERGANGYERASAPAFEGSLSWRPSAWVVGAYGAGRLTLADFSSDASLRDRWSPAVSVGLESVVQPGRLPFAFIRLGYTHVFDDRTLQREAFMISVDKLGWAWWH